MREGAKLGCPHVTSANILRGPLIPPGTYLVVHQGTDWVGPQKTLSSSQRLAARIDRAGQEIRRGRLFISEWQDNVDLLGGRVRR